MSQGTVVNQMEAEVSFWCCAKFISELIEKHRSLHKICLSSQDPDVEVSLCLCFQLRTFVHLTNEPQGESSTDPGCSAGPSGYPPALDTASHGAVMGADRAFSETEEPVSKSEVELPVRVQTPYLSLIAPGVSFSPEKRNELHSFGLCRRLYGLFSSLAQDAWATLVGLGARPPCPVVIFLLLLQPRQYFCLHGLLCLFW